LMVASIVRAQGMPRVAARCDGLVFYMAPLRLGASALFGRTGVVALLRALVGRSCRAFETCATFIAKGCDPTANRAERNTVIAMQFDDRHGTVKVLSGDILLEKRVGVVPVCIVCLKLLPERHAPSRVVWTEPSWPSHRLFLTLCTLRSSHRSSAWGFAPHTVAPLSSTHVA
jgi:hypothetical protein